MYHNILYLNTDLTLERPENVRGARKCPRGPKMPKGPENARGARKCPRGPKMIEGPENARGAQKCPRGTKRARGARKWLRGPKMPEPHSCTGSRSFKRKLGGHRGWLFSRRSGWCSNEKGVSDREAKSDHGPRRRHRSPGSFWVWLYQEWTNHFKHLKKRNKAVFTA